jgi:hypothetical protein
VNTKLIKHCIVVLTNNIIQNYKTVNDIGFINGKLGIATSIYTANSQLKRNDYEEIADNIISNCFDRVNEITNDFTFNGLVGFGYGIEYLVQKKFLDGDTNESLVDFDRFICKRIINGATNDISLNGILGFGIYLFKRIHNKDLYDENFSILTCKTLLKKTIEELSIIINNISDPIYNYYSIESTVCINWQYYYLLLFLDSLLESQVCTEQVNRIINKSLSGIDNLYISFSPLQKLFFFYSLSILRKHGYEYNHYEKIKNSVNNLKYEDLLLDLSSKNTLYLNAYMIYIYNKLYNITNHNDYLHKMNYWTQFLYDNISELEISGFYGDHKTLSLSISNGYAGIVYLLSNLH